MPRFNITDPDSGATLVLEGDSPPNENELIEIFAEHNRRTAQPAQSVPQSPVPFRTRASIEENSLAPWKTLGPTSRPYFGPIPVARERAEEMPVIESPKEQLSTPIIELPKAPRTGETPATPVELAFVKAIAPGAQSLSWLIGDSPTAEVNRRVINLAVSLPEFFSSPMGQATALTGGTGRLAQAGVSGYFTLDLLKSALSQSAELVKNWPKMTPEDRAGAVVDILGSAGLGAMTGAHTLKRGVDIAAERRGMLGKPAEGATLDPRLKAWAASLGVAGPPAETEMVRTAPEVFTPGAPPRPAFLRPLPVDRVGPEGWVPPEPGTWPDRWNPPPGPFGTVPIGPGVSLEQPSNIGAENAIPIRSTETIPVGQGTEDRGSVVSREILQNREKGVPAEEQRTAVPQEEQAATSPVEAAKIQQELADTIAEIRRRIILRDELQGAVGEVRRRITLREEKQPPPFPRIDDILPETKGMTPEQRRDAYEQSREIHDQWERDIADWEAAQPKNKPIIFEHENYVSAITPNIGGGWRTTNISRRDRMPSGHEVYETRAAAVRDQVVGGGGKRIDRLGFQVEPLPERMFPGDDVIWNAPNGEQVAVNFRGFLGGDQAGLAAVFNKDTGVQLTVDAMQLKRITPVKSLPVEQIAGKVEPAAAVASTITAPEAREGAGMAAETGESPATPAVAASTVKQLKGRVDSLVLEKSRLKKLAKNRVTRDAAQSKLAEVENDLAVARSELDAAQQARKAQRVRRGISGQARTDRESAIVGEDIIQWLLSNNIKMMSRSGAQKVHGKDWWKENKSDWDDAPTELSATHHNVIYGGSRLPSSIAQDAFRDGKITEPTAAALWQAIKGASANRVKSMRDEKRLAETTKAEIRELEDWEKSTAQHEGGIPITAEQLSVGDVLEVDGVRVEVTFRDAETGDVTLKDGRRFGEQRLSEDKTIYVEKFEESAKPEAEDFFAGEEEPPGPPAQPAPAEPAPVESVPPGRAEPKEIPKIVPGAFSTGGGQAAADIVGDAIRIRSEAQKAALDRLSKLSRKELEALSIFELDRLYADAVNGPGNLDRTSNWKKPDFISKLTELKGEVSAPAVAVDLFGNPIEPEKPEPAKPAEPSERQDMLGLEAPAQPKAVGVEVRPLTPAEAKEFSDLSRKYRAWREEGAEKPTGAEQRRYEQLAAWAGQQAFGFTELQGKDALRGELKALSAEHNALLDKQPQGHGKRWEEWRNRVNALNRRMRQIRTELTEGEGRIIFETQPPVELPNGMFGTRQFRVRKLTIQEIDERYPSVDARMEIIRDYGTLENLWVAESRRLEYETGLTKEVSEKGEWYADGYGTSPEAAAAQAKEALRKDWDKVPDDAAKAPVPKAEPDRGSALTGGSGGLADVQRIFSNLPPSEPTQAPSGRWYFGGGVAPLVLKFERVDGQPITQQEAKNIQQFGISGDKRYQTRTWNSKEEALSAQAELRGEQPTPKGGEPPHAKEEGKGLQEVAPDISRADSLFAEHESNVSGMYSPTKTKLQQDIGDAIDSRLRLGDKGEIGLAYIALKRGDATLEQFNESLAGYQRRLGISERPIESVTQEQPQAPVTPAAAGAPIGSEVNGWRKTERGWQKIDDEGKLGIPANKAVSANLERSFAAGPKPAETRTQEQILSEAPRVIVALKEGANAIRVTYEKGGKEYQRVYWQGPGHRNAIKNNFDKINAYEGSNVTKVEAGRVDRTGNEKTFTPSGRVEISDATPPKRDLMLGTESQGISATMNGQGVTLTFPEAGTVDVGMPRNLLPAHHGTPHEVDKFSTSKIGTGEGAQVYGWGLYFAERLEVADDYARRLAGQPMARNEAERLALSFYNDFKTPDAALAEIDRTIRTYERRLDTDQVKALKEAYAALGKMVVTGRLKKGNVYTVDLDVTPEVLLDWDRPLSEQPDAIRTIFKNTKATDVGLRLQYLNKEARQWVDRAGIAHGKIFGDLAKIETLYDLFSDSSIGNIYDQLAGIIGRHEQRISEKAYKDPKAASEWLKSKGVKGIRYLDQGSRRVERENWTRFSEKEANEAADQMRKEGYTNVEVEHWIDPKKAQWGELEDRWYVRGTQPQTHNFVIFDESVIRITDVNGKRITMDEARQAMLSAEEAAKDPSRRAVVMGEPIKLNTVEDIRRVVEDPMSNITADQRKFFGWLLERGWMEKYPGLRMEIADFIEGQAVGEHIAGGKGEGFARFLRWADSEAPLHEFMHHIERFLSPEDNQWISDMRKEYIRVHAPQTGDVLLKGLSSDDFVKSGISRDLYHLANDSEFFAWMMTEKGLKELNKPAATTFVAKIREFLTDLWQGVKRAFGLQPYEDTLWQNVLKGNVEYDAAQAIKVKYSGRQASLKQSMAMHEEKRAENADEARRDISREQVGEIVVRSGIARNILDTLQQQASMPGRQTGIARWQRDIAKATLKDPFMRGFSRQMERLNESAQLTDGLIADFNAFRDDPTSTREEIRGVALNALDNGLRVFDRMVDRFERQYQPRREQLLRKIAESSKQEEKAFDKRETAQTLLDAVRDYALPVERQTQDAATRAAFRYVLEHDTDPATAAVLSYLVNHNINVEGDVTAGQIIQRIRAAAGNPASFSDVEHAVNASQTTIESVAAVLAEVGLARERITDAQTLTDAMAMAPPTMALKGRIAQALRDGDYDAAIQLFGQASEKAGGAVTTAQKAANFYMRRTRANLTSLQALDRVRGIIGEIKNDAQLKADTKAIYDELNVRDVLYKVDGEHMVLQPIFEGDAPLEVLINGVETAPVKEVLSKVSAYYNRALEYLNSDDPNPKKVNAIRNMLPMLDHILDPSQNPSASRLIPTGLIRPVKWLFSRIGRPDQIPGYLFQGSAGPIASRVHATLAARSTMLEIMNSLQERYGGKLASALKEAQKSHGGLDPEEYRVKVFNVLAGSRQNFNDARILDEGRHIGNGEVVTSADMKYLRLYREYWTDFQNQINGEGRPFAGLKQVPFIGVLFDKNGQVRLPAATGIDTMKREWPKGISAWITRWKLADTADRKIAFLDENFDRFVIGYLDGIYRADWRSKFNYAYKDILKDVYDNLGQNPIRSFKDLIDRIETRIYEGLNEVDPQNLPTRAQIENDILVDFDRIFKKVQQFGTKEENVKQTTTVFGGDSAFNTPRGELIMPPGWYDYGAVTTGDWSRVARTSLQAFDMAHISAVNMLRNHLIGIVETFRKQSEHGKQRKVSRESVDLRKRGDYLYSYAEAKALLAEVDHYAKGFERILKSSEILTPSDRGYTVMSKGAMQGVVSSLLANPATATMNLSGGYIHAVLADKHIRNQNFWASLASNAGQITRHSYREALRLLSHEGNPVGREVYKLLNDAQSIPIVNTIAELFLREINQQRELYRRGQQNAFVLNQNLGTSIEGMRSHWQTSGIVERDQPQNVLGKIHGAVTTGTRMFARSLGQASVGYVDSWLNLLGLKKAADFEQHFKNLALKFGPVMEESAIASGRNPFDAHDVLNLLPDKAFGGEVKARYVRDLFSNNVTVNLDGLMMDYYKRWKSAKEKEQAEGKPEGEYTDKVNLFSEDIFNELSMATAELINLPTYRSRPIGTKFSAFTQKLGMFLGYPWWQTVKFLSLASRLSNKGFLEGHLKNMPFLMGAGFAVAMLSTLQQEGIEQVKNWLLHRFSGYPTISKAKDPAAVARAVVGATASQLMGYGGIVRSLFDLGYTRTFSLEDAFLYTSAAKDVALAAREAYLTHDPVTPVLKLANSYSFPLNVMGSRLPNLSGLREMTNTRNILASTARSDGDGELLKSPGGAGELPNFTPLTPVINKAVNAIGNGDFGEFQRRFAEAVAMKTREGDPKAEQNVLKMIQARNPVGSTFKQRPTDYQLAQYLSAMPEYQRGLVQKTMQNFKVAVESVGGSTAYTQEDIESNKKTGTGGYSAGTGSSGVTLPSARRISLGGAISGMGSRSLGVARRLTVGRSNLPGRRIGSSMRRIGGRLGRFTKGRLKLRTGRIGSKRSLFAGFGKRRLSLS